MSHNFDTLAGVAQDVLEEHMNLGTSGRYIADYGVSPSDLAEKIALRAFPPGEGTCWCDGPDCDQTPCVEEQGR